MDQLLELSGTGTVILTPLADFTINGVDYKSDFPFFYKTDQKIQLQYSSSGASANVNRQQPVLFAPRLGLINLVLSDVPLTTKLLNLYKVEPKSRTTSTYPYVEEVYCTSAGHIYLTKVPKAKDSIYVLDHENWKLTYNTENNAVNCDFFEFDKKYTILYYCDQAEAETYNLNDNSPDYPYFALDIIMRGNIDKDDCEYRIHIGRVALQMSPVLEIFNSSISHMTMNLKPLDTDILLSRVK